MLWFELCDVVIKYLFLLDVVDEIDCVLDVDVILCGGIRMFINEVGRLWTAFADYYICCGLFEVV